MTSKMRELLDALRRLTVDGVSPSYTELQADLGLKSRSGVHRLVHQLMREGLVRQAGFGVRALQIVEGPSREMMGLWSDAEIYRVRVDLQNIAAERQAKGRAAA